MDQHDHCRHARRGPRIRAKLAERDAQTKKDGETFLAANKKKSGVNTLPSGLQYKVLEAGDGPMGPTRPAAGPRHERLTA